MNKKGNINQLFPSVLTLILVGALLCIGILIISNMQTASLVSATSSYVNESVVDAVTDGTSSLLTGGHSVNALCSVAACINRTGSTLIPAADYVATNCNLNWVTNSTAPIYNNTLWNCTYSYTFSNATSASTAMGSVNTSLSALAVTWLPIIIVVIAAGIVLAILLGAFGTGKRK